MMGKLSLRRLHCAFFFFLVLVCVYFLTSFKRLPEIDEKQATRRGRIERSANVSKIEVQILIKPTWTDPATTQKQKFKYEVAWFFKNGTKYPKPRRIGEIHKIWPEQAPGSDRIPQQLMHVPKGYDETKTPFKTILLWHGLDRWIKPGQRSFLEAKCPVNRCTVTDEHLQAPNADAILFKDHFVLPQIERPPKQIWIIYLLECPYHTERFQYNDLINWTATYRRDSDIVTPYERWVYYDENVKQSTTMKRNYAANKTHQVAWFVSNCNARNGRLNYAHELQKHISVDIYGFCGPLKCPRTQECFQLLDSKYKFYLAFENSNCIDYVTEKFFVNGLQHDILPIVMGARPKDYEAVAPYHSYIHVDDFASPQELAEYLLKLDNDDEMYNSYFRWKETGEFINTHFFCRLCAMLHDPYAPRTYRNLNKWWKNVNTCITSGRWRST